MKEVDMAMLVDGVAKVISGSSLPSTQKLRKARQAVEFVLNFAPPSALGYVAQHHRDSAELRRLCAERDQLRAEKKEFAQEAVRWAEEAGRLNALLHDAQRDAERYRWLRNNAPDRHLWSDASLDAAMAAERKDHSCPNCLGVHPESCVFAEREGQG